MAIVPGNGVSVGGGVGEFGRGLGDMTRGVDVGAGMIVMTYKEELGVCFRRLGPIHTRKIKLRNNIPKAIISPINITFLLISLLFSITWFPLL